MRQRFQAQLTLGCTPIEKVKIPHKVKDQLANLLAALQHIYIHREWNEKVFDILSQKITKGKKVTGRGGMSLWEIFVLSQVRLCLNISYGRLHYMANYDTLLRGILGVLPSDFSSGKEYDYQNIYDNVSLLDDEVLKKINNVIVEVGHEVFKKKETEALRCKTDSFVVETDTHFPTDYNLLWDSARKCLDTVEKLNIPGWRKHKNWYNSLKRMMNAVGKASSTGGKNKETRLRQATEQYLKKARALEKKIKDEVYSHEFIEIQDIILVILLEYYQMMLSKHIDLVERRLIKGEQIPHEEKVFSIFQPYTEMIKKGKLHPNVEIGKKLAITTDQYHLIIDWQIANNQTDNELTRDIANRVLANYKIQSFSVDRGFSDKEDKNYLEQYIPELIMPKKGKRNKEEKAKEEAPAFKRLKNKHSAIESNINELEHRGLNRCPNRNERTFKSYIGMSVTAYNLNKIGRKLLEEERKKKPPVPVAA